MKKKMIFAVLLFSIFFAIACSHSSSEDVSRNAVQDEAAANANEESDAEISDSQPQDKIEDTTSTKEPLDLSYLNTSPMAAFEEAWGQYDQLDYLEYEVMVDQEVVFEEGWETEAPDELYKLKWQREQEAIRIQTDLMNNMEYYVHTKVDYPNELEETHYKMDASRNGIPGMIYNATIIRDYYDEMVYVDASTYKEFPKSFMSDVQEQALNGYISLNMEDDFFYDLDYYQVLLDSYAEYEGYTSEEHFQWIEPKDNSHFKKIKLSLISEKTVMEDETLSSMGFGLNFEGIDLDESSTSTIAIENFYLIQTIDEAGMPVKEEWEMTISSYNEDNIKELTYRLLYELNNLSFNNHYSIAEKLAEKEIFSYNELIN